MSDKHVFTTGDGCHIAYRFDGHASSPVLVLSNSIATDLHMWDASVAELATSFRLLRYDTRGHGDSDAPSGAYSLDRLGRDVVELLDHVGIARAHFLGLSLGGFVGQWLGIHAAERIDRLILSNTAPWLADDLPFDDLIRETLNAADRDRIAETFMRGWFPAEWLDEPNEIVDLFRATAVTTAPTGLAGCYAALRDVDFRKTDALIQASTLVIAGSRDGITTPEHAETIATAIPRAELLILAGVHILNVEQGRAFHQAVSQHLTASG